MRKLLLSFSAVLALSLAIVPAARADTYTYTFSGAVTGSFSLDSSISPTQVSPSASFNEAVADGTGLLSQATSAYFINTGQSSGDLQFPSSYIMFGPQLYTGSESDPTYLTGTFNLTSFNADFAPVTLNVVDNSLVAATPEPSSLVLLGTGALGLAGAIRRRFTA